MNKKIISLSLIVLSSLFLAGCNKKQSESSEKQMLAKNVSEATEFSEAIKSGKPTLCTMTKGQDVMEYTLSGKKMRMNSTTAHVDDKGVATTTVGHMINDTAFIYIWDDKTGQGTKMAIPTEAEAKDMADKAKELQKNYSPTPKLDNESDYQDLKDQGYTINCKAGSVDDSVFTPPTTVKFIDPSAMMKAVPTMGEGGKIDMSKIQELQKQYGAPTPEEQ